MDIFKKTVICLSSGIFFMVQMSFSAYAAPGLEKKPAVKSIPTKSLPTERDIPGIPGAKLKENVLLDQTGKPMAITQSLGPSKALGAPSNEKAKASGAVSSGAPCRMVNGKVECIGGNRPPTLVKLKLPQEPVSIIFTEMKKTKGGSACVKGANGKCITKSLKFKYVENDEKSWRLEPFEHNERGSADAPEGSIARAIYETLHRTIPSYFEARIL